jgi:hypothetical protein
VTLSFYQIVYIFYTGVLFGAHTSCFLCLCFRNLTNFSKIFNDKSYFPFSAWEDELSIMRFMEGKQVYDNGRTLHSVAATEVRK